MTSYLLHLRIAFSAVCGIATVLLVVLWMRSNSKWDRLFYHFRSGTTVGVCSWNGFTVGFVEHSNTFSYSPGFMFECRLTSEWQVDPSERGFRFFRDASSVAVWVPDWFPVVLSATLAALPWIRGRFSLRTLLIVTTLVAVVLGLAVYVARK